MPNHVMNRIFFDCDTEKAKEIMSAVMYDPNPDDEEGTGYGTFDFNKLIPKMMRGTGSRYVATVDVQVSKTFFGWIAQFGSDMRIISPDAVIEQFRSHIIEILNGGKIDGKPTKHYRDVSNDIISNESLEEAALLVQQSDAYGPENDLSV